MPFNRLIEPEVGKRLREERSRLRLTQDEMAQKLGIAKGTYFAYEKETSSLDLIALRRLEEAGVDAYFVLNGARDLSSTQESLSVSDLRGAFARLICHVAQGSGSIEAATLDSILTGILLSQVSTGSRTKIEESHGPRAKLRDGMAV